MHVVFVTAEVAPFSKVGGLADVAGALPRALAREGARVTILTPGYGQIDRDRWGVSPDPVFSAWIPLGDAGVQPVEVHAARLPGTGIPLYLVGNDQFFNRPGIYTDPATGREYPAGALRFIFFVKACLELLAWRLPGADVVHCHDSHTAILPALLAAKFRNVPALARTGTLLTIHNIAYQGLYSRSVLPAMDLGPGPVGPLGPFEYYGQVNILKNGIMSDDLINTVSETYAAEIQASEEYGCGLEGVLRDRSRDVSGVLNGVDYAEWDPRIDSFIPYRYGPDDLGGKRENKRALLQAYGFEDPETDAPVIGIVGRLVDQKGLDLLLPILPELVLAGARLVVLGSGLPRYHEALLEAQGRFPGRVGVRIGFDNALAHLIEAGSDLFLMPSRYEPCGLNQMYSLRYGTVPVVRATGGLADTVSPFSRATGRGTGFLFEPYDSGALLGALREALALYRDPPVWRQVMRNGMAEDFSWDRSARKYLELYRRIGEIRPGLLRPGPAGLDKKTPDR